MINIADLYSLFISSGYLISIFGGFFHLNQYHKYCVESLAIATMSSSTRWTHWHSATTKHHLSHYDISHGQTYIEKKKCISHMTKLLKLMVIVYRLQSHCHFLHHQTHLPSQNLATELDQHNKAQLEEPICS